MRFSDFFEILNYSLNPKIRRRISFEYNAFSEKNALYSNFQFELLCEEFFREKFDYNASPYFRVETVEIINFLEKIW